MRGRPDTYRERNGLGQTERPMPIIFGWTAYPLAPVKWGAAWEALSPEQKAVWFALTEEERRELERLDPEEFTEAMTLAT